MAKLRRRAALQATSLAWIAACHLVGCDDVIDTPSGGEADILDTKSPFGKPASMRVSACSGADHTAAIDVWTTLRQQRYPYHLQTVALSPPFSSGCRALIIAEPPPAVTLAALQDVAPGLMASAETRQHELGYDGWTRDVLVTLPPVKDAELTALIASLHLAMFDTTYRMAAIDTSAAVPVYDPASAPLDVAIGPGELHHWLLEEPTRFMPLGGGEPTSFKELLASDDPEVYLDDARGLIVWIVPRRADIAEMAGLVRQFAVESDIIIGAMASPTSVAIIARQRAIDPRVVQPLRFETVSLLAAVHDRGSLQQSYERTNPLAGKIDETRDWAPIFLSPELLDTEYGSTLDIADQLLKSWSNNGKTRYVNFDVPAPPSWPFPAPVFVVANARSFRYNWNTVNAGAVVDVDGVDVFWLRRTGALNVSYFPDEDELEDHRRPTPPKVRALEETAQEFFARTQTPTLVRVVQYNALFQIFARFGLASSMELPEKRREAAANTLVGAAQAALTTIREAGDRELEQRIDSFVQQKAEVPQGAAPDETHRVTLVLPPRVLPTLKSLKRRLATLDANDLAALARIIGDSRSGPEPRRELHEIYQQVQVVSPVFSLFARPGIHKAYAESSALAGDAWLHTPSVVISSNQPPFQLAIGGHDLSAKVADLTYHPEVKAIAAGQIAGRRPVDAVGAKELALLELGPGGPRLARAAANRGPRSALGHTGERGFRLEPAQRVKPAIGGAHTASVTRLSDGYKVLDSTGAVHEVTTMAEVIELIRNGSGARRGEATIEFEGLQADEVRRVVGAAAVHTQAEIVGLVKPAPAFAKRVVDFSEARLRPTQTRILRGGGGQISHVIEIAGDQPIAITATVAVRDVKPGPLRRLGEKIHGLCKSLIERFSGNRVSPYDFSLELRRRLRQLMHDELPGQLQRKLTADELRELHQLELKIVQEATDFVIVQRDPVASHGTRGLAG